MPGAKTPATVRDGVQVVCGSTSHASPIVVFIRLVPRAVIVEKRTKISFRLPETFASTGLNGRRMLKTSVEMPSTAVLYEARNRDLAAHCVP